MTHTYRSKIFSVPEGPAYVQVFQRPGEGVLLESNYFDNQNHSVEYLRCCLKALSDAIHLAEVWAAETGSKVTRAELLEQE